MLSLERFTISLATQRAEQILVDPLPESQIMLAVDPQARGQQAVSTSLQIIRV